MYLLIDIEDLTLQRPAPARGTFRRPAVEQSQYQLLSVSPAEAHRSYSEPVDRPHPMLIAQVLKEIEGGGDVPPAGMNIPEKGQ